VLRLLLEVRGEADWPIVLSEGVGREAWIAMLLGTGRNLRPVAGGYDDARRADHT
jgi:hypothetical protein